MTGSLDDPQFRMGPLIWKAFVGLLTKIATAPFALLALSAAARKSTRSSSTPDRPRSMPRRRKDRRPSGRRSPSDPALQLEVPTTYSPDLDRAAIAQRRLDGLLRSLPKANAEVP